jgi:hypothetical protein
VPHLHVNSQAGLGHEAAAIAAEAVTTTSMIIISLPLTLRLQ